MLCNMLCASTLIVAIQRGVEGDGGAVSSRLPSPAEQGSPRAVTLAPFGPFLRRHGPLPWMRVRLEGGAAEGAGWQGWGRWKV